MKYGRLTRNLFFWTRERKSSCQDRQKIWNCSAGTAANWCRQWRFKRVLAFMTAFAMALCQHASGAQESMTIARFHAISSAPNDTIPPDSKLLATGPIWSNATIRIVIEFATGKTLNDEAEESTRVVQGKYAVTTVRSQLVKQPMESIMVFDDQSKCYRVWGVQGTNVIEGRMVYDLERKIYAMNSSYGVGVTELGVGWYNARESSSKTLVLTNGVIFCTRTATTRPTDK